MMSIQRNPDVSIKSAKKHADSQPVAMLSVKELNYQEAESREQHVETLNSDCTPLVKNNEP